MPKLICLGDSITAKEKDPNGILKLVPRLKQALPNWTIINSGVPGDNTRGALGRLRSDVLDYSPDLVTVLLGTADASENKGIDIKEYEHNLSSIIKQITPEKTLLISSPPINQALLSARKKVFPNSNFVTMEKLEKYVQVATNVAYLTSCHFCNLWSLMRADLDYSRFLKTRDGVHFNEQGYELLTQILSRKLLSIKCNQ
ncbi:esterase [Pleurocapsa sp. CCALA 161]|uniref:GDSL-type esterase/lipase family protein n=1 Tax=Pleurocapsa sp. CCALA 161 TaxID=2107688 RepID=UPI000D05E400|nr:GDSL-type esterase/lipase family protein [Pleurocapsa sp. CCALA 161]PSB10952.1 esterase [Pleurocapsa sp. CCALA 161]